MKRIIIPARIIRPVLVLLDNLRNFGDLLVRFWLAKIFIQSGLSKISSWTTTIILFKYSYHVPLISPVAAAYMGTAAEFILPVFLVLGLGGGFTSVFPAEAGICERPRPRPQPTLG